MNNPNIESWVAVGDWAREIKGEIKSVSNVFCDCRTFFLFEADAYGIHRLQERGLEPVFAPPGIYDHDEGVSLVENTGARIVQLDWFKSEKLQSKFERFGPEHLPLE